MEYLPDSQSFESIEEEVIYKKVPWISWNEWNFVRKSLFSSSPQSIAAALDRISMWKTRGSLPIVVDVTASIIRNQQKDPKFSKDLKCDTMNQEELANLYCIHIIRLVNGVVDQDRKKRGKKDKRELSINEAADEIGLPRMLIDIRHEASHRDSPSLQLVRQASVKALDWMRSYYWQPQKKAIPIRRDTVEFVRKKIITKLSELAFYLDAQQDSQLGSLPMKRKRNKQSHIALRCCSSFSHKVKKLQDSHSQGPKIQTKRILRILFRLYTSYPLEVVAVLLDFLQKALESSVDPFNDSELGPDSEQLKAQTRTTDVCKLVITSLSRKEPELILIMLKAVLEKLETQDITKFKNGSQSRGICQTEDLSSLVLWLIQRYNKIKHSSSEECRDEMYNSSGEANIVPKVALKGLLKKCLLVSSLGNNQLARSALLLAQTMGNNSILENVTKLTAIFTNEERPEISITSQGTKTLEVLKGRPDKEDDVASNDDMAENERKWTVVKLWNPCPIGMLPGSLGSMGILPILERERAVDLPDIVQNVPQNEDFKELNSGDGTTDGVGDADFLEKMDDMEEMEVVIKSGYDGPDLLMDPFRGKLMIGGVYKEVYSDELHVIENAARILV